MIIGIDASHANKTERTGVEEYCFQIIQELKNIIPSDYQVVLYSNNNLLPELSQLPNNWKLKILNWPFKKMWSQLPLAFELWKNPPNIYFAPGQLLPYFAPKKSVVMIHDSAFEIFPSAYRFFGCQYLKWMNRLIVKKAKKILTSTQFNKQEILKLYSHHFINSADLENKISVAALAYDENKFNLEKIAPINRYGDYILSIGRLEEKKNTRRIVQAFSLIKKEFPELKLVLIGKPGAGFVEVQKEIEQSRYKQDIILPGFILSDDLLSILRNAKVFVFPSLYEGFGIPVLEAMAVGVPVVTSKWSALEEVGKDAAEYIDPFNVDELANKIIYFLKNEDYRQQKIKLGLEEVKKYSWNKTARLTWQVIKNI